MLFIIIVYISFRLQWQKTQAVVLLAEHVVVNITYTDLFVFLKRYNNVRKTIIIVFCSG